MVTEDHWSDSDGRSRLYAWERGAFGLRCVGLLRRFDVESRSLVEVQITLYLRHILNDTYE